MSEKVYYTRIQSCRVYRSQTLEFDAEKLRAIDPELANANAGELWEYVNKAHNGENTMLSEYPNYVDFDDELNSAEILEQVDDHIDVDYVNDSRIANQSQCRTVIIEVLDDEEEVAGLPNSD